MKKLQPCINKIISILLLGLSSASYADFYPSSGELYYNGAYYADSYLTWANTIA